jgi:hypothetical protein
MEQHATVRTIARLPGCEAASACRSGFIWCPCHAPDGEYRLLRIAPHGAVEALPSGTLGADWAGIAVRPDGNAVFTCHDSGDIWMHSAPYSDAPPELVVNEQVGVCALEACEEG